MNELFNRLVIIETNHGYSCAFLLNCSLHTLMARYVALCSHIIHKFHIDTCVYLDTTH